MGIARDPRPQPPGECSNPAHGPKILVDTAKPFIDTAVLAGTIAHICRTQLRYDRGQVNG